MKKEWPLWAMLWLAITLIVCWIITICAPSAFWNFLDIILWIFLIFAGISAVINAFKNQKVPLISILFAIWVLIIFLWFLLICSNSEFIGKFMIWMFALWAFMRWIMLAVYAIQKKNELPLRRGILLLWWLLCRLHSYKYFSARYLTNVSM